MREKKKNLVIYIAAGGTILFWASAFPAVKYSLEFYSPEPLMLFRFLVASAVLLSYCAVKKVKPPSLKDMPSFLVSGFVGIFLYMWAFNWGTDMVPSGISGFIIASAPVYTLILSIVILKEKTGPLVWIGVLTSFAGIIIIGGTQVNDMRLNMGVVLLLGSAVCTSFFNITQKRLLLKYTAIQSIAYSVAIATLFMCIFTPALIREFPETPVRVNLVVVYLGVFPAAISYFLWGYALSKAEKTIHVTSFLYLSPFLASVMAFFWLGEKIPAMAVLGGFVIILGMVVTNIIKR